MALVVFLRGINVGGHRSFRPSTLARDLGAYDVVNVGAAGTLVVRRPGSRAAFLAALRKRLPFEAVVACCAGEDLLQLEATNPFAMPLATAGLVPFVTLLSQDAPTDLQTPITIPSDGDCFVRILGLHRRIAFGVYRRHMKTIGYLGRLDRLFGAPATTRSWTTILAVLRILRG